MRDLIIVGTGGFAREVLQIVRDLNAEQETWQMLGFLDENVERHGSTVHGFPVLGGLDLLASLAPVSAVIAVGNSAVRSRLVRKCISFGRPAFPVLVHPRAWVGADVTIGEGSVICAGTMLTTDIIVGRHVILNLDCTVGHDAVVDDFTTVAPGGRISGAARIGEGCDLGTNSAIIPRVSVGPWSIVGAGAVVVEDLSPNVTAVGVPAKVIKQRPEGWHLA